VWIAVRVDHGHNRDAQTLGFLNSDRLLVGVDDEHQVRRRAHVLDAAESLVELLALALEVQTLLLGEALSFRSEQFVKLAQTLDRIRNRLPVGQHAAEPTRIDVVLRRTCSSIRNDGRSLTPGAT